MYFHNSKALIISGILLLICFSLSADFVDSGKALQVAQNWLQYWQPQRSLQLDEIQCYHDLQIKGLDTCLDHDDTELPELYLVYFANGSYAVVPADDNLRPVLAYSSLSLKEKSDMPPDFKMILESYASDVRYARNSKLDIIENKELWSEVAANSFNSFDRDGEVSPLLSTTWNQDYPYNALCPEDAEGPGGHVYAGCVASAMAQMMKYWNKPIQGTGSNNYFAYGYGYQSANFGATTYLWDEMPDAVGSLNIPVATLLYHCAVGVEMNFAPDGSGSNGMRAQNAFVNYFSYPNATYVQKADYSSTAWEDLLKEQLDNGVPMYYSGSGTEVGHAWNCDGYQGTNYFHFNLGWGGSYNGYFYLNSIVAGGNTLTYYQAAITNAVPGNYTITQPRIQLEAQNCMAGDPFELYVNTYPVLNSWNVQDYSLSIFYEHNTLEYIGADLTGTIAEGGNLTVDASQPGYLHITWDRSTPLFGGGRLLNVHFQSIEPGEFLFMPVDMSYNGQMLSNAEPLMVSIDAAVENMADSRITMTNAMHVGYNTLASLPVNTSYLLPSWNVQHYEFELSFDPQKVQFHDAITEGTLSEIEGDLQSEILSPGLVRISFDSQSPITGSIDLLVIPRFLAIGNGSTNIPTVVSMSNFYYNETAVSSAPNGVILLSPSTSSEEQFPAAVLSVQNYPNPFNPSTTIMLNIPQTGMVKAAIYNLKGQLVYSLNNGILNEGDHSFVWHGVDQQGAPQGNGIYLLKVKSESGSSIRKLTLMK